MITPQQRNAWRGAYLRQLRKKAETDILPEGWEDDFYFDNALEAHFTHFVLNDLVVFYECMTYVLANHPIIVAMGESNLKEDYRLSVDELYDYLQSLSNYAKDHVISFIQCNEDTRESLFLSLKEKDKATFVDLAKSCTNVLEICLLCGYSNRLFKYSISDHVSSALDAEEDYESFAEKHQDLIEDNEDIFNWYNGTDDLIDQIRKYSMFDLDYLDVDLQHIYGIIVKVWAHISQGVDLTFLDKELSIMSDIIIHSSSTELFSDLERLVYLLYGFAPERLFTPKSFNLQELGLLKSEMPIKDSLSISLVNNEEE